MPGRPPQLPPSATVTVVSTSNSQNSLPEHNNVLPISSDTDVHGELDSLIPGCSFPPEDTTNYKSDRSKPQLKVSNLQSSCFILPRLEVFIDKVLPEIVTEWQPNPNFSCDYFVALHSFASAGCANYPPMTPNYLGARIPLRHTRLNIQSWRKLLHGYEKAEVLQFLEYGFPLGLTSDPAPTLMSALANHSSSYRFYTYLDKFFATGLEKRELTGPFKSPPFDTLHVSPLMTAPKKPDSRRVVFDATFGDYSLNKNTPSSLYCHSPCIYDFPTVDDFKMLILKCGRGCYMWKRDLSRFYLQIPLDPVDYANVCCVWRRSLFFFVSLMFGLTHSGLQGQKISSAIRWIHKGLGRTDDDNVEFNSLNYSDDIGGCESSFLRATASFDALGKLFEELGLEETVSKAHPPSTQMPYLGVHFDTVALTMSVPGEKVEELRAELTRWSKKKNANKRMLQSLLGKLFWVARCVKYSRGFMGRLLAHLRELHPLPDYKNAPLSSGCIEDISWWTRYIRRFNGVELLYPDEPLHLELEELVARGCLVCCGDAQPNGAGAFCESEYWSQELPSHL